MRRNLMIFLATMLFIWPCYAQIDVEKIKIYKQGGIGLVLPTYLILKPDNHTYDLYFSGGVIGTYEQIGDTLLLTPKYQYGREIKKVSSEIYFHTVPLVFVKKGKKLIDITPYKNYPELIEWCKGHYWYDFRQIK